MPLPAEADAIIEQLATLYRDAQRELVDELVAVAARPDPYGRQAIRQQRLRELGRMLDAELTQLDRAAHDWLSGQLPEVFTLGAQQGGLSFQWTGVAREAVQVLAADTYRDLLTATRHVRRESKAFIREATKLRVRATLLEGATAKRQGAVLAQQLADRGIAAVTYRNGARHSLGTYGEMVVRTKSAQAYNRGAFISARDNGVTWMECYDGPDCGLAYHDDPDKANGTIRELDVAETYEIAHPNCARSWGPRPDVSTPKEADEARRYSPAEQQAMARQERERVAAAQARRTRPSRTDRAQRRRLARDSRTERLAKRRAGRGAPI